ncbi:MAG: BrnT family toxin [Spirochaetales bacterium]|nr:BrnT family toxin [Spirochaetales bacterium]
MSRKLITWNEEKNQILKMQRGVSFEQILEKVESGEIVGRKVHPDKDKYPNQQIFIIKIDDYIYYVPFIENSDELFLKTIIPSRKLTKQYRGGTTNEK